MRRRVCHLVLWLSVAESIEILSRVDQAEQLEELSLAILVSILHTFHVHVNNRFGLVV